jgi:hypothetical protein
MKEFNSENAEQLTLEETIEKIAALEYIRRELEDKRDSTI